MVNDLSGKMESLKNRKKQGYEIAESIAKCRRIMDRGTDYDNVQIARQYKRNMGIVGRWSKDEALDNDRVYFKLLRVQNIQNEIVFEGDSAHNAYWEAERLKKKMRNRTMTQDEYESILDKDEEDLVRDWGLMRKSDK
jgi:hypothetical protein